MEIVPTAIGAVLLAALIYGFIATRRFEKESYNYGYCPCCGDHMELQEYDTVGRRKYVCNHCQYVCRVSYSFDKYHNK